VEVLDMQNKDLNSSKMGSSSTGGSSGMGSSRSNRSIEDRMRNRDEGPADLPSEEDEDLQQQQIEGSLGNEQVRGSGRSREK
jgi:hypothetical protein